MLRDLLNDVPNAVLVLGVMALVIAAVLLAVWLLRRFVPPTREGFDAEVSSQILGSIAALFGLLLAFVIVVEFQNFEDAQGSVSGRRTGSRRSSATATPSPPPTGLACAPPSEPTPGPSPRTSGPACARGT